MHTEYRRYSTYEMRRPFRIVLAVQFFVGIVFFFILLLWMFALFHIFVSLSFSLHRFSNHFFFCFLILFFLCAIVSY